MGIIGRLFGRGKPASRRQQGLQRTIGHRGTGGPGGSPDLARAPDWRTLGADEVEDFVYGEQPLFVQSSNVAMAQYFLADHKLMVEFLSGAAYMYSDVSEQEAIGFARAFSKGKWVWDNLRGRNEPKGKHLKPYTRVR